MSTQQLIAVVVGGSKMTVSSQELMEQINANARETYHRQYEMSKVREALAHTAHR